MNEQDVFDASLRVYNDARENLDLLYIDHQEMTELAEASRQYAERTELAYARTVAALGQGGTVTPPPSESTQLTGQTGTFVLSATTPVKYGNKASNQFYQRTLPAGTYTCGDQLFGDPASGLNKSCYLVGTDASSPPPSPVTTLPGEPTTPTLTDFYLLHLNEGPAGTRPPQFVNSIGNGPTFNNWGQAKTTGGRFREDAAMPFGMGLDASGADNNPMAISSSAPVTLSGAWTVQGFTDKIDPDRELWQISTNGTDDGACRIRIIGMDTGAGGRGLRAFVKVGNIDVEAFASDTIAPITVAGVTGWHWILQHEVNDTYTLRSNGNLLETSDPIPGDAVGYVEPFGSYDRVADAANGFFQAKVSELRGTRGAVYSGPNYTVPATRFLNNGGGATAPAPISITGLVAKGDSITAGGGGNPSSWPAQLAALLGIPVINNGLQGETMQQMRARYNTANNPGTSYTANQFKTLVLNGLTNDLALDNQTVAACKGYLIEEINLAKATGYKVYISTITKRAIQDVWDAARESRRVELNTWIRANWSTLADGFIDFEALIGLADLYDGIHPTDAGAAKIAAGVEAVLRS